MFNFFNKKNKHTSQDLKSKPSSSHDPILKIFDQTARSFTFPMLDNGYVYLAATRMSVFHLQTDWALVFEVFGFNPRGGSPDLQIITIANRLNNRKSNDYFAKQGAYENYINNNPNNESRFLFPVQGEGWINADDPEQVSSSGSLTLRRRNIKLPKISSYKESGINIISDQPAVFELCRYLAVNYRNDVLATPEERRVNVMPNLKQILCLDNWFHPDLANCEKPSDTETFIQLAEVLSTGDATKYAPTFKGNAHWRNWPDSGLL